MQIVIVIVILAVILIIGFNENKKERLYKDGLMSEEEKIKYEKKLKDREISKQIKHEKKIKRKELYDKIKKTQQEHRKKATTIKQVIIIGNQTDSRKKIGSTVVRGAVGKVLLGPVGMIGGAMSGKNKTSEKTTFLIEYEDGHRETKTVDAKSPEYQKLCNYLKMD